MLIPVILCGGSGTRLWPVSREFKPKPFIELSDGETLLHKAIAHAAQAKNTQVLYVITNTNLRFLVRAELEASLLKLDMRDMTTHIILEPQGRNTAPAIAVAALDIVQRYGADATMLVLSADHLIQNKIAFTEAIAQAQQLANQQKLVTFGVKPTYAETGFGYIRHDGYIVEQFVEKPDLPLATQYLNSGQYLWNAGIFCFQAQTILAALSQYQPVLMRAVKQLMDKLSKPPIGQIMEYELSEQFSTLADISIDYAVMEHADNVAVIPCDLGWQDIGSWQAFAKLSDAHADGNRYSDHTLLVDSHNCFVHSSHNRLITGVGLDDLIIVDTPDALLVAHQDETQQVKNIVHRLKAKDHQAVRLHQTVHRPWGTYTVLEEHSGYKIKRIVVKPQGCLSLQLHHHRSEHWIVVSGQATVINGEERLIIYPNQSTYIEAGKKHRLANDGEQDCVMIEVQVGSYLGEDDIVRFDDQYGRVSEI